MKKLKRRLFFWALVLLFIIVTPIVILQALGYRFDYRKGIFVYSGTITFKSNPQNVTVKLNDKIWESTQLNRINSSYNLNGLLPDDYEIKITQNDFYDWSKKIDVHSGVSTEFWNVILTRKNYERFSDNASEIEKFFMSPKNKSIAYTEKNKNENNLKINIYNISDQKNESSYSLSEWNFISPGIEENIEWSPEEDYLTVPVERTIEKEIVQKRLAKKQTENERRLAYFVIDPASQKSFSLNDFLGMPEIKSVRWDSKNKDYLFFLSQNKIYRANVTDASQISEIAGDVSAFDISGSYVYFVQNSNSMIFRIALDGKSEKEQITSQFPETPEVIKKIIVYDEKEIGLISESKKLFIYNKGEHNTYFRKLGEDIAGLYFSDDGKKMLFWSNYEISTYYLRDWELQPTRSENELTNVTRYAEPLRNVQWFKDYEHVIFSTGRFTKIIELDSRDKRNCMDLIATSAETPLVIYNNYLERLYFTDLKDNASNANNLFYIKFPEPTSLFGIGK